MKVLNPNFAPVAPESASHVKNKQAVLDAIAALPSTKDSTTFDALRTTLAMDATALPDGAIAQICQDAGIKVAS